MAGSFADDSARSQWKRDSDLPPVNTQRWSPKRKALVVDAVRNGAISIEEACRRYQLSAEEFLAWHHAIESHGVGALRVTRLQVYGGRGLVKSRNTNDHSPAGFDKDSPVAKDTSSELSETV
jgi:transposase-like protein